MEIIKISDYVSNNEFANKKITNFENKKLIIKGDTGVGGTSAVLDITDKNVIIISPISGMIVGKENKRKSHQLFIYQNSKDRWQHYESELRAGNNVILNTTPEQIIEIKKNNKSLFNKIMNIPFFVDESQVYSESDYRASMPVFYNILFQEHVGNFTLSTATPTYKNLDIPKHILNEMEIIKIELEIKRKKLISITSMNNYWNFIKSNCEKGIKVILFTNDLNKIKNIINEENLGYKTQILVGDTLAVKSSKAKPKTFQEYNYLENSKIDVSADIYILSTKYQIGFDIEFDASLGIIMDECSMVDNFNVNQVVQSYGRIRENIIEAKIFYNSITKFSSEIKKNEEKINEIKFSNNFLKDIQPLINNINQSLSYPSTNLINSLEYYGFTVYSDDDTGQVVKTKLDFQTQYKNLINQEEQDSYILNKELTKVFNNIKGDDPKFNGYSMKDLLLWATAYMAVETQSKYLLNADAQRYERLLKTAKTFIDVNDLTYPEKMNELDKITKFRVSQNVINIAVRKGALCPLKDEYMAKFGFMFSSKWSKNFYIAKQIINSLYVIDMVKNGKYSNETKRIIHGFSVVSKCILEDYIKALSLLSGQNIEKLIEEADKQAIDMISSQYGKQIKGNNIFNNTNRKISHQLAKLKGYNQSEINQIMDKATAIKNSLLLCKTGIRNTLRVNTYSIESQLERHKNYILSLLSLHCAGHMFGFKTSNIDNRVFNTLTKTTRQLRPYTPYKIVQCDIKSAFASFLDTIVGSNISQEVYQNIMKHYNVERSVAKTMFNMMLNDNTRNPLEAKKFFSKCGYKIEQVKQIITLTQKEKGNFYRLMTKMEDDLIYKFKFINRLDNKAVRLHDAIVMYNTPDCQNLINKIGDYLFEIEKF